MFLNKKQIESLKNNPSISSIGIETPEYTTLAESRDQIGAPLAWANGYDGTGQVVVVIDTGVDKNHPMLSGKIVEEACYSSSPLPLCPDGPDSDSDPDTESTALDSALPCSLTGCDHGTHVAGIVAGNDGGSYKGIAPDAQIIAIQAFSKFIDSNGNYDIGSYPSDQQKALERVYELKDTYDIASVNMSIGSFTVYNDQTTCDTNINNVGRKIAIDNLKTAGIATVIASGNSSSSDGISTPGCISSAYSVGSVLDTAYGLFTDTVSSFSNSHQMLDFLAPGESINSSLPSSLYGDKFGTSMAAPHVAGAWALMKEKYPSWTVDQIATRLADTGIPITDSRNNITKPRIQIDEALSTCPLSVANTRSDKRRRMVVMYCSAFQTYQQKEFSTYGCPCQL